MRHGSLFSGIGGFDLAAQWMRWENVFQVEIDSYCQKVLDKNFPGVKRYGDIKEFDGTEYRGKVDIISGGFPCQPFSVAGKRKGNDDDRALWFQMFRIIREVQPRNIVAENVPGLLTIERGMVFEQVCLDLESTGYEVQPVIIPACGKNAPHKRERIWIVANSDSFGKRTGFRTVQEKNGEIPEWDNDAEPCYTSTNDATNSPFFIEERGKPKRDNSRKRETEIGNGNRDDSYANYQGLQRFNKGTNGAGQSSLRSGLPSWDESWYEVATRLCRVDDGVSNRVERLKGLGNAIVPKVAYEIFKAIEQTEMNLIKQAV